MKAMVITAFGGPEVFKLAEVSTPVPGPTELLVKVMATSINPVDYKIRQAGSWARIQFPAIIGFDAAGIVAGVGENVKKFKVGDEVFYTPQVFGHPGTYAEYNVVDESIVATKPEICSYQEAAALPLAGCTALDAIHFMQLQPGQIVLVHAAAGGVGSLAVQMAKAKGARVFGTCSPRNNEFVAGLGVEECIDYRGEDFVQTVMRLTAEKGVDAVFDTVGGETLSRSLGALKPYGRIASITNTTGDLSAAYFKNITVLFEFFDRSGKKMEELHDLVESGAVRPLIDSVLPLEKVAEAHTRLEKGGVRGKIVLSVG
jgi:NADPH2:quinone reductase